MENGTSSEGKDPSAFLSEIIGAPVTVRLNSGVVYKGLTLTCIRPTVCANTLLRGAPISRWLHEYCIGKDCGVCERQSEEELWRCFCSRKQWFVTTS